MAMKGTKNPELSMEDSVRDRAKAKQASAMRTAGVSKTDLAGNEHLMQSKHFGADATPKNPMSKMLPEKDGLPGAAAAMSKRFIGG
jgi:hypothetical protein